MNVIQSLVDSSCEKFRPSTLTFEKTINKRIGILSVIDIYLRLRRVRARRCFDLFRLFVFVLVAL